MLLTDFHIHSTYSDGTLTIPQIVDLFGKSGFDVICITDHLCESSSWLGKAAKVLGRTLTPDTFPGYIKTIQNEACRAWDQYRMIVLPGYEITKNSLSNQRSAHLLAVGSTNWVSADQDIVEIAKELKSFGALVGAAHPVNTRVMEKQTYHLWDRREELCEIIDVWEGARLNKILEPVINERLRVFANSDLHNPRQMNAYRTLVDSERHPLAILEAVRKQKIQFFYYEQKREFRFIHSDLFSQQEPKLA